jgi:hypothetical protein
MITVVVALLFLLQVLIEGFWFRSRLQEATSSELDIAITIGLIFKSVVRDITRTTYVIGLAFERFQPSFINSHAQEYYRMVNDIYPVVQDFVIADSSGKITAGSNDKLIGTDISGRSYFHEVKNGDSVVVSNFLNILPDNQPGFVIAQGFYNKSGTLNFAVIAGVLSKKMGVISLSFKRQPEEFYVLFDKTGTLIYTNYELV